MPAGEIIGRTLLYAGLIYIMASIGQCNRCNQRDSYSSRNYNQQNSSIVQQNNQKSSLDSIIKK